MISASKRQTQNYIELTLEYDCLIPFYMNSNIYFAKVLIFIEKKAYI